MSQPTPLKVTPSTDYPIPSPRSVNGARPDAASALRGASLAFNAPPPPAKPLVNTYSGTNGALAAATKAGLWQPKAAEPVSIAARYSYTPGAVERQAEPVRGPLGQAASNSFKYEQPATGLSRRQQSPSHIAARAATRPTPAPAPLAQSPLVRGRSLGQSVADRKDETPIPATNTLVELFESKIQKPTPQPASGDGLDSPKAIVSPKPIRPNTLPLRGFESIPTQYQFDGARHSSPRNPKVLGDGAALAAARSASPMKFEPARALPTAAKGLPAVPPPRRKPQLAVATVMPKLNPSAAAMESDSGSSASSYASARDKLSRSNTLEQQLEAAKPASLPPTPASPPRTSSFTGQPLPSPLRRPSSTHTPLRPASLRLNSQISIDSLANAMVASSLASSRARSPTKVPPSLPRRHTKGLSLFPGHHTVISRTPSPGKPMRQTMRPATHYDSDDGPNSKKPYHHGLLSKKHPHKHAEGDRKRWRDAITERERKRYEGVWAANRGLLIPMRVRGGQDVVHGLVVRDIWTRSQLGIRLLEEIWELVEGRIGGPKGMLGREEFVVGMWLVDQCLKGRKLPIAVGDSVWDSVRQLTGVRIGKLR